MYICTKYWLTSKQIWLIKDEPLWISSLLLITFYRCTMTLSHSPSQWEHFTISIYITSDIYGWWHYSPSHILSPEEGCTELPKPSIAKVSWCRLFKLPFGHKLCDREYSVDNHIIVAFQYRFRITQKKKKTKMKVALCLWIIEILSIKP